MMLRRLTQLSAGWILTAGLLLNVAGCATQQPKGPEGPTKLVWPAPPQPTRIEFLRSIVSEEDLGHDTTFSQKMVDFLTGQKPEPDRVAEPVGVAVSDDGQVVYVSDATWRQVFIFDFAQKSFSKIENLEDPREIALDDQQNLYVVEQGKKGVSVFDRQKKRIKFITDKGLERPTGVAVDRQRGKVYVADAGGKKSPEHLVRVFSIDGKLIGRIGHGKGDWPGQFAFPTYLTLDGVGNLYVTDTLNGRVQVFDPNGKYLNMFGKLGDGWGMFARPKGVALDTFGNLYVVDSGWSNVQMFNQKGQVLLFFGGRGPIPGMLKNPTAIAIDKNNHIYVADYLGHRIEEYRLVNTKPGDSLTEPGLRAEGGESVESRQEQVASRAKGAQSSN